MSSQFSCHNTDLVFQKKAHSGIVPARELTTLEHLFGRYRHALNELPFFGILDDDFESLLWSGGGRALIPDLLRSDTPNKPILTFTDLFQALGLDDVLRLEIQEEMSNLEPGADMTFIKRLPAPHGRTYNIVFKSRDDERCGPLQFTLNDLSPFVETEIAIRKMAS